MNQPDWSKAPEWAMFHAVDSSGFGAWYEVEPHKTVDARGIYYTQVSGTRLAASEQFDYHQVTLRPQQNANPTKELSVEECRCRLEAAQSALNKG